MRKICSKRPRYEKLSLLAILLFIPVSGCAGARTAPKEEIKPWVTFAYDGARTNFSGERIVLPLIPSWSRDISPFKVINVYPKEQSSVPVISDGSLYVGSTNGKFYSFDLRTGRSLWKFNARYPIDATATVAGSLVCFGTDNGTVRCLERATGKERWRFQARAEVLSSPLASMERIYFFSSDDRVYALNINTGEKVWIYGRNTFQAFAPRLFSSPASSADSSKLYQLFSDGVLVCLSADSGKVVWEKRAVKNFDSADKTRRTPLVAGGLVYIIDDTNSVVALDGESGETKGVYNIIKANDFIVPDSSTIVIAGTDRVISVDRTNGAILWKKDIAQSPVSTLFAAGEHIFVVSNYKKAPLGIKVLARMKGYVQALSIKSGEVLWESKLDSAISANASSSDGRVALLTDKGYLAVFEAR